MCPEPHRRETHCCGWTSTAYSIVHDPKKDKRCDLPHADRTYMMKSAIKIFLLLFFLVYVITKMRHYFRSRISNKHVKNKNIYEILMIVNQIQLRTINHNLVLKISFCTYTTLVLVVQINVQTINTVHYF